MKIYLWSSTFVILTFASTPLLLSYTSLGAGIDHDLRVFLSTAFILIGSVLQILNTVLLNQGREIGRLAIELRALKSKNSSVDLRAGSEIAGKVSVSKNLDGSVEKRYLSGHDNTH